MLKRLLTLPVIACLTLVTLCSVVYTEATRVVPYELLMGEYLIVEVVVADTIADRWMLDTGAGGNIVSQKLFDRLTCTPAGRLTGFRMMGERLDIDMYQVSSLEAAGMRQENVLIAPWPALDNMGISGILSLKFFEHQPFTINFAGRTLTIETEQSTADRAKSGTEVPIETQRYRDKALDVFVMVRLGDTVQAEFELDTGSGRRLWIDSRFMSKLGIDSASDSVTAVPSEGGMWHLANLSAMSLWEAPSVAVDSIQATFRDSLIYDGVMGTAFWDNRTVTFDLPNRRLIVQ
jgi:hypothetical protein